MPYIFTGMKPFKTLFLSIVIMFYIFASFKHQIRITKYTDFVEAIIESGGGGGGGGGKNYAGRNELFSRYQEG